MSLDVSRSSAHAETHEKGPARADATPIQVVSSDDESTSTPRLPVEVVVHGEAELAAHESDPSIDAMALNPAEEVAILLGEKRSTGEKSSTKATSKSTDETTKSTGEKVVLESVVLDDKRPGSSEEISCDDRESRKQCLENEANFFAEMGLSPCVLEAIDQAGYETPTPIQSETVPYVLEGRDLMGQAETGSGKTAAFAWPLLSKIDATVRQPQVLVLAPTRELAIQVTASFERYARGIKGFRAVTIYGGQSYETQLRALSRGVQVVVGTPGRVMDHLRRQTLDLSNLKTLVLDEADEMLRMGFIDDVEWILEQIPNRRQILSFSATLPAPIQRIAKKYLHDPAHVAIKSKSATADSIKQSCLFLHPREKMERLVRILETEETDGVIIFVKTRNSTVVVAEGLTQRGIIATPLNGDIPQNQRERTINQLKSGRINVVVATDVAARGLDVQRISHVINYDFPHDTEAYVHRIGRTGRAGRTGNAILFVEPKEKGKLGRLQYATNQRIDTFKQKSIEEINQVRVEKFKQRVVDAVDDSQVKFFAKLISDLQNDTEIPFDKLAGALALLAQGESPLLLKELTNRKSNWKKSGDKRNGGKERGPMTTYRIEVGRQHGIGPGNIVGAVTNEANLNNGEIGRINIFDRFSTIDLPSDLPQDTLDHLQQVHVSGQRLAISKSDRSYAKSGGRKSGPSHGGARSDRGKRYGEKRLGAKSSGNRKSNANGQRTEFGAKRDRLNRGEASRHSSGGSKFAKANANRGHSGAVSSKFSKPKPKSAGKTKNAERTKANRKLGAKPSNPMKKYVKIRSAN